MGIFVQSWRILGAGLRRGMVRSFVLSLVNAVLELLSIAMVLPLVLVGLQPTSFRSHPWLDGLEVVSGFESDASFVLILVLFILAIFVLKSVAGLWIVGYQARFVLGVASELSKASLTHYFNRSFDSAMKIKPGQTARDVMYVPIEFANGVLASVIQLCSDVVIVCAIVGGIAVFNLEVLATMILLVAPILLMLHRAKVRESDKAATIIHKERPLAIGRLQQGARGYVNAVLHNKVEDAGLATGLPAHWSLASSGARGGRACVAGNARPSRRSSCAR